MTAGGGGLDGVRHRLVLQVLRWRGARLRSSGGYQLWSTVHPGGPFLTLLARAPDLALHAGPALGVLRREHPEQYHYPPGDVHVTLLDLDHVAADPTEAVRAVTRVWSSSAPLRLVLGRLEVSEQTVYCPAVEITGQLRALRRRLGSETGLHAGPAERALDDLVFANAVRFQAPLDRRALRRRSRELPQVSGVELGVGPAELVLTDKVLSRAATRRLLLLPPPSSPVLEP